MLNFIKKAVKDTTSLVVDIFVPGIGPMEVPIEEAESMVEGYGARMTGYSSVSEIKAAARPSRAKKNRKPVFILSKSRVFRKRVGRIIYGKEGEELFL